jgi:hypothetical protein
MLLLPLSVFFLAPAHIEVGRLSVYRRGDGHNAGTLSCGGQYDDVQNHIAHRKWRRLGCGRKVVVCAHSTGLCAVSKVRDAGPFGVYKGRWWKPTAWKVWPRHRPPQGWKWRGHVDLSWALWKTLGRPKFFSGVTMVFYPKKSTVRRVACL